MSRALLVFTDGGAQRMTGRLEATLHQLVEAAGDCLYGIVLREQVANGAFAPAADREVASLAETLAPVCARRGVNLLISARADIAAASGAAGVHLNSHSVSCDDARRVLGEHAVIGYSAHDVNELQRISREGATYATLSPIYPPLSKTDSRTPLGLSYLQQAVESVSIDIFALGGIAIKNVANVRRTGAAGIGVISSVVGQPEPAAAAHALSEAWQLATAT
ncbi:MAG: thiamine phosphate synthase [Bdellovibrionales bacterium]|nr:thiamine phosphate synthase [Bdellovibrionales bacterium]